MPAKKLGTAMRTVKSPHAGFGKGPNGEDWMYVVCTGDPAVLSVIDVRSGRRIHSFELPDTEASWGIAVDPRGNCYIGTSHAGLLYRYTPGGESVENLGSLPGETHTWRIAADERGNIYGGTYPNGKVYKYDPQTSAFIDFGSMAEGEQYVRSVACGRGKVYAGTGSSKAQLFEIDPDTGFRRQIPLPEPYRSNKEVYDLTVASELLFARLTHHLSNSPLHNVTLVYDLREERWMEEWRDTSGWDVSPPDPQGRVYFKQGQLLMSYCLKTRKLRSTGFDVSAIEATRGFAWIDHEEEGFVGPSLVCANMRGRCLIYNPGSGRGTFVTGDALGPPAIVRALAFGPDGLLYVGAYGSPGMMSRYDRGREAFEPLPGMPQVEGMQAFRGKLYIGTYPHAGLYVYDPQQPWAYGKNPHKLPFTANELEQDRPFAMTPAGDLLAIGTTPVAGRLGGALSFYDPETATCEVHRDIVPGQSVLALACRDGLVYGGTSVWGGYGISPTEEEGKLFIWDVQARQNIWEASPVPGERAVSALCFDADGTLWGVTNGWLFAFDPSERRMLRRMQLVPYEWRGVYLAPNGLHFHTDGMLYCKAVRSIFRIDPQTWEKELLASDVSHFAQDECGDLYFVRDRTQLYAYELSPILKKAGDSV